MVGIDEAGYGPNLGPFVMSAVAVQAPATDIEGDLWSLLNTAVKRPGDSPDDDRIVVGDSKQIYSPDRGIGTLERELYPFFLTVWGGPAKNLRDYVARYASAPDELKSEPWYSGRSKLPIVKTEPEKAALRLNHACCERGVRFGGLRSEVICCQRFNALLAHWGSKGAVLGDALATLIAHFLKLDQPDEGVIFLIDKHGGRNTYAAMLQDALDGGMVIAHHESMERSEYSVLGLSREIRFVFAPKADTTCFPVALASMASKYLRELLMREFNRYWRKQVPGLKPTHGYPGDAQRFYQEVRSAAAALEIPESSLWRMR